MLTQRSAARENWVEITIRRELDDSYRVNSVNFRREKYTNRFNFKGGLPLAEALRPSLAQEVLRMSEMVDHMASIQEFPDFRLDEDGVRSSGASLLSADKGVEYQQFMLRLNRVEGRVYALFSPELIEEELEFPSPDTVIDMVRQKIIEPVNKLSTVFEGYDKETTFAIIPAYFSVLRRLMNARLERLEMTLRGQPVPLIENKSALFPETELDERITQEQLTERI